MILDTIDTCGSDDRLYDILVRGVGASVLCPRDDTARKESFHKFRLALMGVRAHVVADTWAHQDFCGRNSDLNTYSNLGSRGPRESIQLNDQGSGYREVVLSMVKHFSNANLEGTAMSKLGHAWMGHLPDFSFIKFKYRPFWAKSGYIHERDNPFMYRNALLELCSLFSQCRPGKAKFNIGSPNNARRLLTAETAMNAGLNLSGSKVGRVHSEEQWRTAFRTSAFPCTEINTLEEPSPAAQLKGVVDKASTRNHDMVVDARSDLYYFHLAADYHYRFVVCVLKRN